MRRMDSRVVALADIDAPFIARWRALANRPGTTPNPFMDVDFLRPAAAYQPEAKGMRLFVGEDDGELLWLLPRGIVAQLVQVLRGFDAFGVEFERACQGGAC